MNEQDFKAHIRERFGEQRRQGRRWVGVVLLVAGALWLAKVSGAIIFPRWFFTWPMFLIGIGILSGIRHGFRRMGWVIPIIVGVVFLSENFFGSLEIRPYVWPIVLIAVGLLFLFRPKKNRWLCDDSGRVSDANVGDSSLVEKPRREDGWDDTVRESSDTIDATAILGGVKKLVLSKNFKGGDITTFMGGAEINLSQADCNGRVMIDCFNMFGGTKLIIPSDWDVKSELVTVFGGIEDKRQPGKVNPNKVLFLDGTCIFGGVELKSF